MSIRTCVGCRSTDEQSLLIRFIDSDLGIVEATNPRLPGRGAYVHGSCLALARKRKTIERALRSTRTRRAG